MPKQILWFAVTCVLLAYGYVQETGKDIPYVSPAVRSFLEKHTGLAGSQPSEQGAQARPAGAQRTVATEARAAEPSSGPGSAPSAFAANAQVTESGTVIRISSDDSTGSRHQRFIVRLGSGQTLLIAHNIDLAPRIEGLRAGDTVSFCGEYEPNAKGGVIHWTHRDPAGRHPGGWVQHNGRSYQ